MRTTTVDDVLLRDVTLRDGLQLTGKPLPTERKVQVVRELLAAGVPSIEIGSMARGDLVPSMANTPEVIEALTAEELERCWVWVATPRHVAAATERGAVHLQYCLSASTSHNEANLGRTTERSLDTMPEAVEIASAAGADVQLCLATTFTCPFEGLVPPDRIVEIANDPRTRGSVDIVLCDTLGQATPDSVSSLVRRVADETPERRMVYHGHDTWGMGVATTLAAVAGGVQMVDGALGGLGGCPFAPGASGNTSSEDLLFALQPEWLDPETFHRLVRLSDGLLAELGEPGRSRAVQGAHSEAAAFPWVISAG
ncbi:hypothetical protein [Solicola sp. PLA-1-18]|uniref:hypothetical protein n=1 Tax=Solicola sp. PLA-1-18 TaxID=3380532 RepID=UPI003B82C53D